MSVELKFFGRCGSGPDCVCCFGCAVGRVCQSADPCGGEAGRTLCIPGTDENW